MEFDEQPIAENRREENPDFSLGRPAQRSYRGYVDAAHRYEVRSRLS